jgi:hypothetical protein
MLSKALGNSYNLWIFSGIWLKYYFVEYSVLGVPPIGKAVPPE